MRMAERSQVSQNTSADSEISKMRRVIPLSWPLGGLLAAAIMLPIAYFGALGQPRPATSAEGAGQGGRSPGPGELIYVPIYSSIFYEDGRRTLELAATLSIHNIDPDRSISITRADYYNTGGALIKKYVDKPIVLKPLETTNIVIEKADKAGGTGANFLVAWEAPLEVNSPLVEAVMVNASSNLGIAFTTSGRVIKSQLTK
jgi:uncharacterized protein DUF3124